VWPATASPDYSAGEARRLRAEYAAAEKACREAREALKPFGQYDFWLLGGKHE